MRFGTVMDALKNFNDGGFNIPLAIGEVNKLISETLTSYGKAMGLPSIRGKCPQLAHESGSLKIKFSFSGNQQRLAIGQSANKQGILTCQQVAIEIGHKLINGSLTHEYLDSLKPTKKQDLKAKSVYDKFTAFKDYFLGLPVNKNSREIMWVKQYQSLERFIEWHKDKFSKAEKLTKDDIIWFFTNRIIYDPEKLKIGKRILITDQDVRSYRKVKDCAPPIKAFLDFSDDLTKQFEKLIKSLKGKHEKKIKSYPDDNEILNGVKTVLGLIEGQQALIDKGCKGSLLGTYQGWLSYLVIAASYGLRPHEFWNIKNWDNPVKLVEGDYVSVEFDSSGDEVWESNKKDTVIKAMIDPSNDVKLLAIGNETKTGYRLALPVIPDGLEDLFNQIVAKSLIMPKIAEPLSKNNKGQYNCSDRISTVFDRQFSFMPYSLRHAFNQRAHEREVNSLAIAQAMGHGLKTNQDTYLKRVNESQKKKNMTNAVKKLKSQEKAITARLSLTEAINLAKLITPNQDGLKSLLASIYGVSPIEVNLD